jgi:hypothetical protein
MWWCNRVDTIINPLNNWTSGNLHLIIGRIGYCGIW